MTGRDLVQLAKSLLSPLEPIPTGLPCRLNGPGGIHAILFDVYGTLLVSGSGDVGTTKRHEDVQTFRAALLDGGFVIRDEAASRQGACRLEEGIKRFHGDQRARGVSYPEVEIRTIWRHALKKLAAQHAILGEISRNTVEKAALSYECRVNPVWPMPGAVEILRGIVRKNIPMGIVSNAQFYTPILFQALFDEMPQELGFADTLCTWSHEILEAKPSRRMFEKPLNNLMERFRIAPDHVLYVGNDMYKDVWTASRCGMKTALFAGDLRSLRLRKQHAACIGLEADYIITALPQILTLTS